MPKPELKTRARQYHPHESSEYLHCKRNGHEKEKEKKRLASNSGQAGLREEMLQFSSFVVALLVVHRCDARR
ncbi:hypothetical protein U1Q18_013466 [Sarracenia purpurea var. burkii]